MKLCFFMNTPFTLGGEQRVTTEIANYLYTKGIDITFVLLDKSGIIDRESYQLNKNIKVCFLKEYGNKKLILRRQFKKILNKINYRTGIFSNNLDILKKIYLSKDEEEILVSNFEQMKFDYIIGVGLRYTIMLSLIKKKLNDTKVIGWQHSTFEAYFETKNSRLYNSKVLAQYMFENLNDYFVQTNYDKLKIKKEFNFEPVVINNPNSVFQNNKINCDRKENIFITTGRFVKLKNYDKIILAFNKFLEDSKEWKLVLVGDGTEKKRCEELVKNLKINDYVIFAGRVTGIENYYRKSKIYICASDFEGWGMSITEAMMFKNAIISFDFPSVREIFENNECGIILQNNTIDDLHNAMIKVALTKSKDEFNKIIDSAYEQVEKFDIKIIGNKWINYLYKGENNGK